MTLFLILAPYGVYALMMLVTSATLSLVTAGAVCLATIAFDKARGRSVKTSSTATCFPLAGSRKLNVASPWFATSSDCAPTPAHITTPQTTAPIAIFIMRRSIQVSHDPGCPTLDA